MSTLAKLRALNSAMKIFIALLSLNQDIGVIYADKAPELAAAVKKLECRHNIFREYVDESEAVIEREIRKILEGIRSLTWNSQCSPSSTGLWQPNIMPLRSA